MRYRWMIPERLCNFPSIKSAIEAEHEILRDTISESEKSVEAGKQEKSIRRGRLEDTSLHSLISSESLGGCLSVRHPTEKQAYITSTRVGPYEPVPRMPKQHTASSTTVPSTQQHPGTVSFPYTSCHPCPREASRVRVQDLKSLIPSSPPPSCYGIKPAISLSTSQCHDVRAYNQEKSLSNAEREETFPSFRKTVQAESISSPDHLIFDCFSPHRGTAAYSGVAGERISRQRPAREPVPFSSRYAEPRPIRISREGYAFGKSSATQSHTQSCLGSLSQLPPSPPLEQPLPCKMYYHNIRAVAVHYIVDEAGRETEKRGQVSTEQTDDENPQVGSGEEVKRKNNGEKRMTAQFSRFEEEGRNRQGGVQGVRPQRSSTSRVRCRVFSCKRYGRQQAEILAKEFLDKISSTGPSTMSPDDSNISLPAATDTTVTDNISLPSSTPFSVASEKLLLEKEASVA
ncbi:hypothetical protein TGMAS_226515 [Toxoplasma gondii MAS]|uniref:Uncharacterized protein n=1 Tax=Toxoplasma gondii MAS TaxID=943118 RepID=A0A086QAT1_TOXGO|nr:hypothetical protein TGMAS_226515 [Toxoplasma gondii MAS]